MQGTLRNTYQGDSRMVFLGCTLSRNYIDKTLVADQLQGEKRKKKGEGKRENIPLP